MSADIAMHAEPVHTAITSELVRLTLGARGPQRPELNVTFGAHLARLTKQVVAMRAAIAEVLLPAFRQVAAVLNDTLGADQ